MKKDKASMKSIKTEVLQDIYGMLLVRGIIQCNCGKKAYWSMVINKRDLKYLKRNALAKRLAKRK